MNVCPAIPGALVVEKTLPNFRGLVSLAFQPKLARPCGLRRLDDREPN
jgi:hypothetical protein